ncbi:hypothetical protein DMUE_1953 [Dictyocoela muelleri]|nr:hypothetical protein DMUE_1953 [Dictyocoela muelleri]
MTADEIIKNKNKLNLQLKLNLRKFKFQISYTCKAGDEILIRKHIYSKLESRYLCPNIIKRISNDKQRIYYEDEKGVLNYRNVKQVIPYWRSEVSCNDLIKTL